jgi:hypothetical protein
MPTVPELEQAFKVYFEEIEGCRARDCYWALLHVVVNLPDICGALESLGGETTPNRYKDWCKRYRPSGLTGDEYWEMRNRVLHQGRSKTASGRFYKFTKPAPDGSHAHRTTPSPDVMVLDVGELAKEMISSIQKWFVDLQGLDAERRNNVTKNLPSLVTVKTQALPGITGVITAYNVTGTST